MSALQENGRVIQDDGLKFYEQDIVPLDYVYTEDVIVDFDVIYNRPGFGLVFSASNKWGGTEMESGQKIIAKVGTLECTFYEKTPEAQSVIEKGSCTLSPDGKEHTFRFSKTGTQIHVYELSGDSQELLGRCNISDGYDRYTLGIYSSAGNIVRSMDIKDNYPSAWGTSVKNTNGGRLSFEANGFTVENAENAVEIIQENVLLKAGRYFPSYQVIPESQSGNVSCYVFPSTEPKIKAPEKNLLKYDEEKFGKQPFFDLVKETEVTILFQTHDCEIKNIAFKENAREGYVSTDKHAAAKSGSFLQVDLSNIESVEWKGIVDAVPLSDLDETPPYGIVVYGEQGLSLEACHIHAGKKYDFAIKSRGDLWVIEVVDEEERLYYGSFAKGEPTAKIFYNISGSISSIKVKDTDGNEKDIVYQRTVHKAAPRDIDSPIIIVDKDGVPFDLSASYRILSDGSYYFTNWEREVFKTTQTLKLQKKALSDTDIILYGLKEQGNMDKLYDVSDEDHVNSIDAVTKRYDSITNDHFAVSGKQEIIIDNEIGRKGYASFIVDYLKNDSYAINEKDVYEIMVSTNNDDAITYYDMADSGEIRAYKVLDISPEDDKYIVLRRARQKS